MTHGDAVAPEEPVGDVAHAEALDHLARGELEILGRLVSASNTTLLADVELDGRHLPCVYKPVAGEAPLWDFPDGTLAGRERAAYVVSAAAGWDVVPPTVLRDGPAGLGSVQLWVGPAPTASRRVVVPEPGAGIIDVLPPSAVPATWRRVVTGEGMRGEEVVLAHADDARLRRLAVFDIVVNNADRKGGHVVLDSAGRGWGIDHGLTFHEQGKLRTVLWGWAGERLGAGARTLLEATREALPGDALAELAELMTAAELDAVDARAQRLLERGRLPRPPASRALPWPPF